MIQLTNEDNRPGACSVPMSGESNGWLGRDGVFFPCSIVGHRRLAADIIRTLYPGAKDQKEIGWDDWYFDSEFYLEQTGWVKLTMDAIMYVGGPGLREPSPEQVKIIVAWHEARVAVQRGYLKDFPELQSSVDARITYNDEAYELVDFLYEVIPT